MLCELYLKKILNNMGGVDGEIDETTLTSF